MLSPNSIVVLEMIAAGSSYEQILAACPHLTYLDIFRAATDALDITTSQANKSPNSLADIRKSYPRAYVKWTVEEEHKLRMLLERGLTVAQIANRLERQRSAIRSRIVKLNLADRLSPQEQTELARIIKLDPVQPDPSEYADDDTK